MNALPDTFRIALLTSRDARAYKELRDASLQRTPEAFSSDWASAVAKPAHIYSARFGQPGQGPFYLGAFDTHGRLVGSLGCEREEAQFKRHVARIVAVMTEVKFEGRGVARQLLEACISHAENIVGLQMLQLSVTASNERAVRLYERAGFRSYGLMPRATMINGVGHDQLLMIRPLPGCPELNIARFA